MKLTLIGTDGREYKVIRVEDARTGRPLQPGGLALVAREVLEAGRFTSDQMVLLSDPRVAGMVDLIDAQMKRDPDWLSSLPILQYVPQR